MQSERNVAIEGRVESPVSTAERSKRERFLNHCCGPPGGRGPAFGRETANVVSDISARVFVAMKPLQFIEKPLNSLQETDFNHGTYGIHGRKCSMLSLNPAVALLETAFKENVA